MHALGVGMVAAAGQIEDTQSAEYILQLLIHAYIWRSIYS